MTKKYMAILAAGSLLATAAIAQSPSPNAPSASPSATPSPSASTAKPTIVNSQKPDQFLASKFKGSDVLGPDDKKIGDVNDLLFDKTGNIQAVIVGVGGFLGIGAKDVALTMSSFDMVPGTDGASPKLKVSMTKDDLTQAPAFEPYKPPQPAAQRPTPGGSPTMPRGPATQ